MCIYIVYLLTLYIHRPWVFLLFITHVFYYELLYIIFLLGIGIDIVYMTVFKIIWFPKLDKYSYFWFLISIMLSIFVDFIDC